MRNLLKRVLVQFVYPVAAVLIILSVMPEWESRGHWEVLFIYTIFTVIVSFISLRYANTILTLNSAVSFSGILLYGTWVSAWSVLIEAMMVAFLFRSDIRKVLANIGQLLMTVWFVGWIHELFVSISLPWVISDLLLLPVYWCTNAFLCGIAISYFVNSNWLTTIKKFLTDGTSTYLLLLLISETGARLYQAYGELSLILVVAAFITIGIIFRQYFNNVQHLERKVEEVKHLNDSFLIAMAASIDARDPYTHGHSHRVAYWGREIARELGLTPKQADEVYYGGILHDIGKIGIEDQILNKQGKLTREEYEKIKEHPVIGYEIIKRAGVFEELLPAIRHHHERIDGKGYPDGLSGDDIPLIARILAISDAFDAMVSDRPYRKGLPVEEALKRIREGAGTQFDAALAELFISLVNRRSSAELEALAKQYGSKVEEKVIV